MRSSFSLQALYIHNARKFVKYFVFSFIIHTSVHRPPARFDESENSCQIPARMSIYFSSSHGLTHHRLGAKHKARRQN